MIGVDTNVLIRLLAADHAGQTEKVRAFFGERSLRDPAFVSAIVLIEALWVSQRRLRFPRAAILDALRKLLASTDFRFQHGDKLAGLLGEREPSTSDIADNLIAWSGEAAGCTHTVTFDGRAARSIPSMELLA